MHTCALYVKIITYHITTRTNTGVFRNDIAFTKNAILCRFPYNNYLRSLSYLSLWGAINMTIYIKK